MTVAVCLSGPALNAGITVSVTLVPSVGPLLVCQRDIAAPLQQCDIARTDRGVTITASGGRLRIDLVEHLLGAAAGLGIRRGFCVRTDDSELPILDGGGKLFTQTLRRFDLPHGLPPALRVLRAAAFHHGCSTYQFSVGPRTRVSVEVNFPSPIGRERAEWYGDPDDFAERFAPARTFLWSRELDSLRAAGRVVGVVPETVLVFDDDRVVDGGPPPEDAEIARHKLLDLLGDCALYGGAPLGSLDAVRPGHTATHAILREAIRTGVLEPLCRAQQPIE